MEQKPEKIECIRCCCNCRNQITLFCHPLNDNYGKGSITQETGSYVCIAPEIVEINQGIFFEKKHGLCEMWEKRHNQTKDSNQ